VYFCEKHKHPLAGRFPLDVRHPIVLTKYRKKDNAKKKKVDYAAYEYNVYVRCNYNEGNKGYQTAKKTVGRT